MNRVDYIPIEQLCPHWKDARARISNYLNDLIGFNVDPHNHHQVQLFNNRVTDSMQYAATFHDYGGIIRSRLQFLNTIIDDIVPASLFTDFIYEIISDVTLARMNNVLRDWESARLQYGYATLLEICKHFLGIEQSYNIIDGFDNQLECDIKVSF